MRHNGFGQHVSLANCLKSAALGQAGPWAPQSGSGDCWGGLSSRGWGGGAASASAPGPVAEHCEEPSPAAAPRWATGRGRALILLAQTVGPWPPPSRAMHFLCVSGERSSHLEGVCVRTPSTSPRSCATDWPRIVQSFSSFKCIVF